MSYLQRPRLHFSGRFEADVSTVNNDVTHFNNETFTPNDDDRQTASNLNGWWNPRGTGSWRLLGCSVKSATYADGSAVPASDPLLSMRVAHNGSRVAPKLVDLDPQQQGASALWGLEIRLVDASGADALRGAFATAPFSDLWNRAAAGQSGDFSMGAFWQSVLENVVWGDGPKSRWLRDLRDAVGDGPVSVKFNVDGYSMDWNSPLFATGRIAGTIGPASAGEPQRFVLGRQLAPSGASTLGFGVAHVDAAAKVVVLDLGNAIQTTSPGGPLIPGSIAVAAGVPTATGAPIAYGGDGWYENTAGIIEAPLTDAQLATLAGAPLLVVNSADNTIVLAEASNGAHVRADQFVFRLDAGDHADIELYTTRFGALSPGVTVSCSDQTNTLLGNGPPPQPPMVPPIGTPPGALTFKSSIVSDDGGVARLRVQTSDPNNPRGYIDGQLYGIAYSVDGMIQDAFNFVSILLFDAVADSGEPAWWNDLQPIFQMFANLYPIMKPIVDLSSYDQVAAKRALLTAVFNLPDTDPNYMPVTRDLSRARRERMLRWLATTGNGGLPNLGTPPPAAEQPPAGTFALAATPAPDESPADPNDERGSKTAFVEHRPNLAKQVKL